MRQTLKEFSRNMITNHDLPPARVTLSELVPGELFVYKNNTTDENVYIRTDDEDGCVYLPTGTRYSHLNGSAEVIRTKKVTIERS